MINKSVAIFKRQLEFTCAVEHVEVPNIVIRKVDRELKVEAWNNRWLTFDELTPSEVNDIVDELIEFKHHKKMYNSVFKTTTNIVIGHGYRAHLVLCDSQTKQAHCGVFRVHFDTAINVVAQKVGQTYSDVFEFDARCAVECAWQYVRNTAHPVRVEYLGSQEEYEAKYPKQHLDDISDRHGLFG